MCTIRCVLVEDELPAMEELEYILRDYPDIEIVGREQDGKSALVAVRQLRPNTVFLDINIPEYDGMELARLIQETDRDIVIIFVTAYDQYAIRAFEVSPLDYILKPFDGERIARTIGRLRERLQSDRRMQRQMLEMMQTALPGPAAAFRKLPCKTDGKIVLVDIPEICVCYTVGNRTYVRTGDREYDIQYSLSDIEKKTGFIRVHRCYLVNPDRIVEMYPWFNGTYKLVMNDAKKSEVPVSRGNAKHFKEILHLE